MECIPYIYIERHWLDQVVQVYIKKTISALKKKHQIYYWYPFLSLKKCFFLLMWSCHILMLTVLGYFEIQDLSFIIALFGNPQSYDWNCNYRMLCWKHDGKNWTKIYELFTTFFSFVVYNIISITLWNIFTIANSRLNIYIYILLPNREYLNNFKWYENCIFVPFQYKFFFY